MRLPLILFTSLPCWTFSMIPRLVKDSQEQLMEETLVLAPESKRHQSLCQSNNNTRGTSRGIIPSALPVIFDYQGNITISSEEYDDTPEQRATNPGRRKYRRRPSCWTFLVNRRNTEGVKQKLDASIDLAKLYRRGYQISLKNVALGILLFIQEGYSP